MKITIFCVTLNEQLTIGHFPYLNFICFFYFYSTFNMDEFKRTYSNKELSESLPYLWEHFDKEHYSFWFCEYKFPEELTQIFMTSNLIGGLFEVFFFR
jgi:hypothetical protein